MVTQQWAILVVWKYGGCEYVKSGSRTAVFSSRRKAREMSDFMLGGMADEVQSMNVVQAPQEPALTAPPPE